MIVCLGMDSTDRAFLRCPKAGLNEDGNTGDEGRDAESFREFCPTRGKQQRMKIRRGHCRGRRVSLRVQCGEGIGGVFTVTLERFAAVRAAFQAIGSGVARDCALRTRKVEMVGCLINGGQGKSVRIGQSRVVDRGGSGRANVSHFDFSRPTQIGTVGSRDLPKQQQ